MLTLKNKRRTLNEDDGGGYGGDFSLGDSGMGGMGNYHTTFLTGPHMKQIIGAFTAPFSELYSGAQKALVHTKALAKVGFETLMTSLIPMLSSDYDDIFKLRDKQVEQVNQKYSEVRKATYAAFHSTDFLVTAFCMQPLAFVTGPMLLKSPKAAYEFLKFVGGDEVNLIVKGFSNWWNRSKQERFKISDSKILIGKILSEEKDETKKEKIKNDINTSASKKMLEIFSNENVQKAIENSPKVKQMKSDAAKALESSLNEVFKHAQEAIQKASSIEELNKMSHGKLNSALQKSKQELQNSDVNTNKEKTLKDKHAEESQTPQIDQILVNSSKSIIKEFYVKKATEQLQKEISLGLPQNHQYVTLSKKNIERIKNL